MRRAAGGHGVVVAVDLVGVPDNITTMLDATDTGGRVVLVAMTHDPVVLREPGALVQRQVALVGSYGFRPETIEYALGLAQTGALELNNSISHEIGFDEVAEALKALHARTASQRRVVVRLPP